MMEALQIIWFLLVVILLLGYCVLDGFDLGIGFWTLFTTRSKDRGVMIRSIEPFWDGNEVWLLTGGGALFAAFPQVYAAVFSGFYLALMLVLFGLILRAIAIEFRSKIDNAQWHRTWDTAFSVGSLLPSLLYGVAVGNVVRGIEMNSNGDYTGGFLALLNPYSLLFGALSLAMFALHGALYLAHKTDGDLRDQARVWASKAWWPVMGSLLVLSTWTALARISQNTALPVLFAILATVALLGARAFSRKSQDFEALLSSAGAIALVVFACAAILFPNLVPASNDPAFSLTVYNASSSKLTLAVMLVIALIGMPVVIGYTVLIHRIFRGKITNSAPDSSHSF